MGQQPVVGRTLIQKEAKTIIFRRTDLSRLGRGWRGDPWEDNHETPPYFSAFRIPSTTGGWIGIFFFAKSFS